MEPFDSCAIPPPAFKAGARGRRNVSPVWWSSDKSSFCVSGPDEAPDDRLLARDEYTEDSLRRKQPVQMKPPNPPVLTTGTEHHVMSFANRLQRQPAAISLSKQYMESGKCNARESDEAGAVEQQTICSTVTTQDSPSRTNHRASRHYLLSADMNQPEVVKISSGSRRASAQTAAATLNAGVCEGIVGCADQWNGHKSNDISCSSTEGACTRSSILSETTASIKCTGNVTAKIDPVQHIEASKWSPQQAEFLNVHSSRVRHESLQLPSRRDLRDPHIFLEEQHKPGRISSIMAKLDSKVKARVQEKRQIRRQPMLRADTDARQAVGDHGTRPAKLQKLPPWGAPLDPKALRGIENMLSQRATVPAHLGHPENGTHGGQPFDQRSANVPGSPRDRPYRGHFVLGQAQAVRMTKPEKARLVGVSPKKSRSFDINSLSSAEADLMASAGAVARSSRRSSVRTDGEQSSKASTPDIEATTEPVFPMRGRQQSLPTWAVPGAKEHTPSQSKQPLSEESRNFDQDVRFRQLVQRLDTYIPEPNRDGAHALIEGASRRNSRQEAVAEQQPELIVIRDAGNLRRQQVSPLEQLRYINVIDPPKRKAPVHDGSMHTSPSKIPTNPNTLSGNSGCPSLISDDGREPSDFPDDMADDHAQTPISQNPQGILAWEKEEAASTSPNGTPSESSFTLVDISMDGNELSTRADTSQHQPEENDSSCSGHGWWYREPRAVASSLSFNHGNLSSRLRERHRGGRMAAGRQPNELTLYAQCAILRWLISTTDAPGTPGMWHESSVWWELVELADEYQLRYDDDVRAEMLRVLRFLSDPEEPTPEPSQEVQAFLQEIFPPSVL